MFTLKLYFESKNLHFYLMFNFSNEFLVSGKNILRKHETSIYKYYLYPLKLVGFKIKQFITQFICPCGHTTGKQSEQFNHVQRIQLYDNNKNGYIRIRYDPILFHILDMISQHGGNIQL